ncbi:MAG: YhdP family protein, partial [Candidatus Berkiella sp.]
DTKISSTLAQGMKAIAQSPLPNDIVKSLAPLALQGDMALSLGLEIPLSNTSSAPVKVRGLIEVNDATVALKDNPYQITSLKGEVNFTQNSVKAHNLTGMLLDNPAQFTIDNVSTTNRNEVLIGAKGNITVEQIQTLLDLPDIKQVKGETEYTALLSISPQDVNHKLTLNSSLVGVAIDAPVPFVKEAQANNPLELVMYLEPNQLLRLSGKYGDMVSLAYSLKLQDKHWHSAGGHLHFGEKRVAKFREDQILLIDGNLPVVDFLEWKTFLTNSGLFSSDPQAKMPEPLVELDIGLFTLYGAQFDQENIQARWDGLLSQWSLLLDGAMLKGQITVPKENSKAIMVDFQKVALPQKLAQSNFTMSKVPSSQVIDIKIKELLWGNKSFSDLQARLEPNWKGYFIPNISTKLKDTQISMSGNWDYVDTNNQIFVQGKLSTKNISQTLTALGLKGTVQKARGIVDFSLTWNGSPFDIDFASLVGLADFSLKNGVIVGMNPGIGRVLSLLNLDNVKRRLNLDFSDVTKDGFAFTELDGKFQFGKGKIISNKVTLNGPSAKIEAFGQADLANQGLDGEMIVMPNVTGSLPVAAAIAAGNPAVGAAVWVVDKVFGHKIQQIHRMRYKVLGTWASPKVNEVPVVLKG